MVLKLIMIKPILDPPIPYVGLIQTRFIPGKFVRIEGTVLGIAYRFNINLQCGQQTAPQDDIALHISVRLLEGHVVLNSLQHGIWDEELRNFTLPIKRGGKFEIVLACEFNRYKVAINGQHYCEFPQRIRYDRISHLAIDGDVSIVRILYGSSTPTGIRGVSSSNAMPGAPPLENLADDFEVAGSDSTGTQPPSYEAATSAGPPYPTNSSEQMPQPHVPSNDVTVPLNAYPSSSHTEIPPPPPQAPVLLNAPNSHFRPIRRHSIRSVCIALWVVIFTAILIIVVVVLKIKSSQQRYSSNNLYIGGSDTFSDSNTYGGSNLYSPTWDNSDVNDNLADTSRWLEKWLKDREEHRALMNSIFDNSSNSQ